MQNNDFMDFEISKSLKSTYNPLLICDNEDNDYITTLIKYLFEKDSSKTILYVPEEKFIIDSKKSKKQYIDDCLEELLFMNRYNECDILIIDGTVQLFTHKLAQEQLFKVIIERNKKEKKTIILSNSNDDELEIVKAKLLTQFKWCMVLDYQDFYNIVD